MANKFTAFNPDGGNLGIWADPEHEQLRLGMGNNTTSLYNDAGTLKLSLGHFGLDDGSQEGAIDIDTITTISIAGLTASRWAQIEVSRTGTTPNISITSIAAGTDPAALPTEFTSKYSGAKQGYYIDPAKRCLALAWINAAGALEGIINCLDGPNFAGYSTSDDAYDTIYNFHSAKYSLPLIPERKVYEQTAAFTAGAYYSSQFHRVTNAASSFNAIIPAASAARVGQRIRVEKIDTGAGITTVARTGADTLGVTGATAFQLRKQGDFWEGECVSAGAGYAWACIDSLATLDSAALAADQLQTLAHGVGVMPRKFDEALICNSAELGYSVNDMIRRRSGWYVASNNREWGIMEDGTNYYTATDDYLAVMRKDTGARADATFSKWFIRIYYSI